MSVSSDEVSAHGDEDHGVRDVDAFLVVAHEASPSCHPSDKFLGNGDNPEANALVLTGVVNGPGCAIFGAHRHVRPKALALLWRGQERPDSQTPRPRHRTR